MSAQSDRARVAIIGASGYTGGELCRLLLGHPRVDITTVMAKRAAGQRIDEVFPHLRGLLTLQVEAVDADTVAARADVAFAALPHGESALVVAALRARGVTTLDLSADFRLHDAAAWASNFGHSDPFLFFCSAMLSEGVQPEAVEPIFYSAIETLAQHGPRPEELARAKKSARPRIVRALRRKPLEVG